MNRAFLRKVRRNIVVIKYTMSRGYAWCQLPTLSLIAAGVLKPYFPGLSLWQLALCGFTVFMIVGYIDKKFRFLNEEQSYATEQNSLLMNGLFGKENNGKIK